MVGPRRSVPSPPPARQGEREAGVDPADTVAFLRRRCAALSELRRFRHFKRYYFAFDYDWERLELVRSKYLACRNQVRADLEAYAAYVERLAEEARKA